MAGRLPDTRRIRVVTARRGEDGERESSETKDGERESLETKDGDRESLETKDGDRESLETKELIRREWRLAGQSRPYIRPQSAGSWISRSRGVRPSRSIRYQSEQLINQIVYEAATAIRVVGKAAPWDSTRSKIATSRRSGLGYQEFPN